MFPTSFHLSVLAVGLLAQAPSPASAPAVTATVEQCVSAVVQADRSATFAAQMTLLPGAQRMAMQFEVQERGPTDNAFHTIVAPGLGVWRQSETGVKVYKYVKQVTNLTAPALFRAQVRYRWLDGRGRTIRHVQRHTPVCEQRLTR